MSGTSPTEVFHIPIEGEFLEDALSRVSVECNRPVWIVTANPEILLAARKDPDYAKTLRQADARTVDGFGLWLMLRLFGDRTHRVTGMGLSEALLHLAEENHWRVGLIGGTNTPPLRGGVRGGVASFSHWESGGTVAADGSDDEAGEEARHRMMLFDPHVLLVAFGHPKQERWIFRHLGDFPNLCVVVGVGGTFDFWSGRVRRAPLFFQRLGLEWLWRLFAEPRRLARICRAVFVFPVAFLVDRLTRSEK